MNYQVFARKWRPKTFLDVVGQQHIIQAIVNGFQLNRIHHAYILSGTRGIGKTTIARLIAKVLNCKSGITSDMCNECKNCQDIDLGCFSDLIEIDAASRTKVEETREFLNNVQYYPAQGRFKVYLIDEIHMLSRHSFNALLKTLEEPPEHVKFILVTTEYQKLPETITSRCLQFYLRPLDMSHIVTQLIRIFNAENITIDRRSLELLAYASKGSMRDALNLSEQAILLKNNHITSDLINNMLGILNIDHAVSLIESLVSGDINGVMSQIENYAVLGINWDSLFKDILTVFQKIAMNQFISNTLQNQINNNIITEHIKNRIYELSNRITPENVHLYYQIFLLGRRELPYAPSYRMGIEITLIRALAFHPMQTDLKGHSNNNNILSNYNMSNSKKCLNNTTINSNTNNVTMDTVTDNVLEQPNLKHSGNVINLEKCIKINSSNSLDKKSKLSQISSFSDVVISETTTNILEARSKLITYQKDYHALNDTQCDFGLNIKPQQIIENIVLEQFSNTHKNFCKGNDILKNNTKFVNHIESDEVNFEKDFYKNCQNIPFFIQDILQQAIQNDPWILKIYRLSLLKPEKKLIINSYKKTISSNEINLYSKTLHHTIQKELSNMMGIAIILNIIKDDCFLEKTPLEYIYMLYKNKIEKLNKEFEADPYLKKIQLLFDATLEEGNIKII